jgi:hypothetical protein
MDHWAGLSRTARSDDDKDFEKASRKAEAVAVQKDLYHKHLSHRKIFHAADE